MTDTLLPPQQGAEGLPPPPGTVRGTDLILRPSAISERLRHFPEEVYSLDAESHLMKLMKVLLGDTGAGQLRKRYLLARLSQTLHGTHFYDLDRFYGSLFNLRRGPAEKLSIDPYTATATNDEWEELRLADSAYRSRIQAFARAIGYGATPLGMELVAEAVLSCDVVVTESFTSETDSEIFNVLPSRPISNQEWYDLRRVLERLRPASTRLNLINVPSTHTEISLTNLKGDSEYWDVVNVITSTDPTLPYQRDGGEQPSPPWSEYQGEAWSYITDVYSVTSYTADFTGTVIMKPADDRIIDRPGQPDVTFSADRGLVQAKNLIQGRLVSEGVMAVHPYLVREGTTPTYVDNINFISTADLNSQTNRIGQLFIDGVKAQLADISAYPIDTRATFWATPQRLGTSPWSENLEVRFRVPHLINHIAFQAARFPHLIDVQVWDDEAATWTSMAQRQINYSSPTRISDYLTAESYVHPHHHGKAHWEPVSLKVDPIETSRIRITLTRYDSPNAPLGFGTQAETKMPYSLSVKDLDVGYRVRTASDLPWDLEEPIESSVDMFRSRVDHVVRQRPAQGLLDVDKTPWVSEPQPFGNAVINLYVDTADSAGFPQVIDQWYLDPIYVGPRFNLYWSNGVPSGDFDSENNSVPYTHSGTLRYSVNGMELVNASVSIDTRPLRMASTQPWWVGFEVIPRYEAASGDHALWSWGDMSLVLTNAGLVFRVGTSSMEYVLSFDRDIPRSFALSYDGTSYWLHIKDDGAHILHDASSLIAGSIMTLGGTGSNQTLRSFIVKAEVPDPLVIEQFLDAPVERSTKPKVRSIEDPTGNSKIRLVRYPSAIREVTDTFTGTAGAIPASQWDQTSGTWQLDGSGMLGLASPVADWNGITADGTTAAGTMTVVIGTTNYGNGAGIIVRGNGPRDCVAIVKKADGRHLIVVKGGTVTYDSGPVASLPTLLANSTVTIERTNGAGFTVNGTAYSVADFIGATRVGLAFQGNTGYTNIKVTSFTYTPAIGDQVFFRGGPGDMYASLGWQRIPREYILNKGYLSIPPTKARWWKFEFSNLVPQPYETFITQSQTVRLHPPSLQAKAPGAFASQGMNTSDIPGLPTTMKPPNYALPDFQVSGHVAPPQPPDTQARPTEALYSPDPTTSQVLAGVSWAYGFMNRNVGGPMPAFVEDGPHNYVTLTIDRNSKIGYFVGLSDIRAFRQDYTVLQDREAYVDHFLDWENLTIPFSWDMEDGKLYTGTKTGAEVSSKVFQTHTNILGVQFATQQSPPSQLLPNDEFRDRGALLGTDWTSTSSWQRIGDAIPTYEIENEAVRIDRAVEARGMILTEANTILAPINHSIFSTRDKWVLDLEGMNRAYGGLRSPEVTIPELAQVTAAARVTLLTDLTSPLILQILGQDGDVLSEKEITGKRGDTLEWFTTYTKGSEPGAPSSPPDLPRRTMVQPIPTPSFRPVTLLEEPGWTPTLPSNNDDFLRVQVVQLGASNDSWRIDTISLFGDAIIWEFSNDGGTHWTRAGAGVRNNPEGVVVFSTVGNQLQWRLRAYAPGQVVSSVKVRPWYDYTDDNTV